MPPASDEIHTLASIAAAVERIEKALTGDAKMGHVGIVARLATCEAKTESLERQRETDDAKKSGALWVIGAAASVAGAIGGLVAWAAGIANYAPKP